MLKSGRKLEEVEFRSCNETLAATLYGTSLNAAGVVLCPPHPLYGGSRNDSRIVHIARVLARHGIAALCMDYGAYGKGIKEVQNVLDAVEFMRRKGVGSLGLLGYSFGAVVASNAAVSVKADAFIAVSTLRKVNGLVARFDFDCPKLFIHGKRDNVASYFAFEQIYADAKEPKQKLVLDTDHFYMNDYAQTLDAVSERVVRFLQQPLSRQRVGNTPCSN